VSELFLYDDAAARAMEPFALTRPACELRAGALLVRERWERATGRSAAGVIASPQLRDFEEPWGVRVHAGKIPRGSIVANSRCAVGLSPADKADSWRCSGRVAAVVVSRDIDAAELSESLAPLESLAQPGGAGAAEVHGRWMDHVWDFIAQLAPMLVEDIAALQKGTVEREQNVFVEDGANVEPHVIFDTAAGPVLVRRGATIQAFTRVVGPCVIGMESVVGMDKISGCSIGEVCRVHGELSATIFLGHSNKAHDGFLGHSYLGRWVNLGAGTITSNLKNTYGTVQLWTPAGEHDSGLQFLGTMFGDHAKTGIGTSLNTGTIVGAGANIYGSRMPPKVVPPFAWGERPPYSTYRIDKFLDVAKRVMARRHVDLSDRQARQLTAAFERRWSGDTR
jgi:UDP-N-acetylglucosamine diphosphorylase / glucose-1-phosphate thymidylyltransferase / UDP-N-acetylgalactosamine diphosphorylase / glucosamine-1-phosphate N-acetyltransferase / galactosamine-1-phosphate N-acetyltransferase